MSTVAWDGKTLAADCMGVSSGVRTRVAKIVRLGDGRVVAWTGMQEHGLSLLHWYTDGAAPETYPAFQRTKHWTRFIVASPHVVVFFEQEPVAQPVVGRPCAWGSGRDFALGAMACGADARKAVEIASIWDIYTGMGCQAYDVRTGSGECKCGGDTSRCAEAAGRPAGTEGR